VQCVRAAVLDNPVDAPEARWRWPCTITYAERRTRLRACACVGVVSLARALGPSFTSVIRRSRSSLVGVPLARSS
jgi:hypothetical protein